MNNGKIILKGVFTHNLKNLDLTIKREKFTLFVGPSGSGKSSMAISTIFAEGQRRYLDSLSGFNRRILQVADSPELESASGIPPAICVQSKRQINHLRSTLGTVTGIYDTLRGLFARVGRPYLNNLSGLTGNSTPLTRHTPKEMLEAIQGAVPSDAVNYKMILLAPVMLPDYSHIHETLLNMESKGFIRARVEGEIHSLETLKKIYNKEELKKKVKRPLRLDIVIDRLMLNNEKLNSPHFKKRLQDSMSLTLEIGKGKILAHFPDENKDLTLFRNYTHPQTLDPLPEIDPQTFSFNSKKGACAECLGTGYIQGFKGNSIIQSSENNTCNTCGGRRLSPFAESINIGDKNIHAVCSLTLADLQDWLNHLSKELLPQAKTFTEFEKKLASPLIRHLKADLDVCLELGLGYLQLGKPSHTLSMGETQKVQLIAHLRGDLSGILYVLDEPTTGLHASEVASFCKFIRKLIAQGNTVIATDHNPVLMEAADEIVEFGPGAGAMGGEIVFQGSFEQLKRSSSQTGLYLSGKKKIDRKSLELQIKRVHPQFKNDATLGLQWIKLNSTKADKQQVKIPLHQITAITGPSGTGKTKLVFEQLVHNLGPTLNPPTKKSPKLKLHWKLAPGTKGISNIITIDQAPLGKNSKSNLATYSGIFTSIRNIYSQTKDAKIRGFSASQFSFNHKKGGCSACKGSGSILMALEREQLQIVCEECEGKRFSLETLQVLYKGRTIHDVLNMTVDEASLFFRAFPHLVKMLTPLINLGLGYIRLGQPAPTLSGGENQRIKLAQNLKENSERHTLFLLDEPCTGLNSEDVCKLFAVLASLVQAGHTVVAIEQQQDFLTLSDYLVEMGPGRGEQWGQIKYQGLIRGDKGTNL